MAWQLQDAKQQLSRVVDLAGVDGPQVVTRHGREVAVVMSIDDYRRLSSGGVKESLRDLADAGHDVFDAALDEVVSQRRFSVPRDAGLLF